MSVYRYLIQRCVPSLDMTR